MTDILEQAKDLLGKTIDPYMEDPYMEGEPREIPYPTLRSFFNLEDGILRELIAEVERLRSLTLDQQYMMDDLDKEITAKDARIKELEVLGMFREGDAKDLSWVAEFFEADCEPEGDRIAAVIRRYEQMAALMET